MDSPFLCMVFYAVSKESHCSALQFIDLLLINVLAITQTKPKKRLHVNPSCKLHTLGGTYVISYSYSKISTFKQRKQSSNVNKSVDRKLLQNQLFLF